MHTREQEQLSGFSDEDYLILDCPGQVELYSHIPVMKNFVDFLKVGEGQGASKCSLHYVIMSNPRIYIIDRMLPPPLPLLGPGLQRLRRVPHRRALHGGPEQVRVGRAPLPIHHDLAGE